MTDTKNNVIEELKKVVSENGSVEAAADDLGVSSAYLSYVINKGREPGKKILQSIGYSKVILYLKNSDIPQINKELSRTMRAITASKKQA